MLKPRETHGRSGRKERRRGQRKEGSKRGHPAGKEEARGAETSGEQKGAQKGASLRRAEWFRCSPGGVGRGAKKEQKEGRRPELVAKVFMIW